MWIAGAMAAGFGLIWKLIAWRQRDYEARVNSSLADHEQRIRDSVSRQDWESLSLKVDALVREMHEAIASSCTHNTQTRIELHNVMLETERRLSDKLDQVLARRDD
jgi:hypothetical protein